MKVKYNKQAIDVPNKSKTPNKEFYADWNDYTITINKEKKLLSDNKQRWYIQLTTPRGGYDYDGYFNGTMREALQDCFDNIDYPPMDIEDDDEDNDEDDDDSWNPCEGCENLYGCCDGCRFE